MSDSIIEIFYHPHYDRANWGDLAYAKEGDAGFDMRAAIAAPVEVRAGRPAIIPFGVSVALPAYPGPNFTYELQIRSRSGLAAKNGIFTVNSPGTIDAGYRGEVKGILGTLGETFVVEPGMRIAQAVLSIVPIARFKIVTSVEALGVTERGTGGFGSTGVKS